MIILDASALIAFVRKENGKKQVEPYISYALMSAVNFAEVVMRLQTCNIPMDVIRMIETDLLKEVIPFERDQVYLTAELREQTKLLGLSFADRACLALGKLKGLSVLTGDKAWAKLDIGVEIKFIR